MVQIFVSMGGRKSRTVANALSVNGRHLATLRRDLAHFQRLTFLRAAWTEVHIPYTNYIHLSSVSLVQGIVLQIAEWVQEARRPVVIRQNFLLMDLKYNNQIKK